MRDSILPVHASGRAAVVPSTAAALQPTRSRRHPSQRSSATAASSTGTAQSASTPRGSPLRSEPRHPRPGGEQRGHPEGERQQPAGAARRSARSGRAQQDTGGEGEQEREHELEADPPGVPPAPGSPAKPPPS